MSPTDDDILRAVRAFVAANRSLIGIGALAKRLGTTTRKLGPMVERLADRGALVIERPTTRPGERLIGLDGDDVEAWRARAIATQARLDDLLTVVELAAAQLLDAINAARGAR